jgi:hypothetical protein
MAPNTRWFQIQGGSKYKGAPITKWLQIQGGPKYKAVPKTRWLQIQGYSKYKVAPFPIGVFRGKKIRKFIKCNKNINLHCNY